LEDTLDFKQVCRDLGNERIALAEKCTAEKSWMTAWTGARHPFPIKWGECWKAVIELSVQDFAAELGFFLHILGFDVNAIEPNWAMLMTPDKAYMFSLIQATEERPAVSGASISIEFMVEGITALASELTNRGLGVSPLQAEWGEEAPMRTFGFTSPNGLNIKVWGMV